MPLRKGLEKQPCARRAGQERERSECRADACVLRGETVDAAQQWWGMGTPPQRAARTPGRAGASGYGWRWEGGRLPLFVLLYILHKKHFTPGSAEMGFTPLWQ